MPRKLRAAKARRDFPLSEAAHYWFITGTFPNTHICGARNDRTWHCEVDEALPPCVAAAPLPGSMTLLLAEEHERRALWLAHRDDLVAEARAHGFTPAAEVGDVGDLAALEPAVTAEWRRAFLRGFGRARRRSGSE